MWLFCPLFCLFVVVWFRLSVCFVVCMSYLSVCVLWGLYIWTHGQNTINHLSLKSLCPSNYWLLGRSCYYYPHVLIFSCVSLSLSLSLSFLFYFLFLMDGVRTYGACLIHLFVYSVDHNKHNFLFNWTYFFLSPNPSVRGGWGAGGGGGGGSDRFPACSIHSQAWSFTVPGISVLRQDLLEDASVSKRSSTINQSRVNSLTAGRVRKAVGPSVSVRLFAVRSHSCGKQG